MGQLRHMGHWDTWDIHFVIPKKQLQGVWFPVGTFVTVVTLETGVHSQVIRFTTDRVVARDMITMDHLLSVYQGDANVVADENPARAPVKNSRREGFSSKSSQKNERGAMPILAF